MNTSNLAFMPLIGSEGSQRFRSKIRTLGLGLKFGHANGLEYRRSPTPLIRYDEAAGDESVAGLARFSDFRKNF